jgi:hypothetical protein
MHDEAIIIGFECERIPAWRPCAADRRSDFAHNADFGAVSKYLMRDRATCTDPMQDEIAVLDFTGQQSPTESRRHARRQIGKVIFCGHSTTGLRP